MFVAIKGGGKNQATSIWENGILNLFPWTSLGWPFILKYTGMWFMDLLLTFEHTSLETLSYKKPRDTHISLGNTTCLYSFLVSVMLEALGTLSVSSVYKPEWSEFCLKGSNINTCKSDIADITWIIGNCVYMILQTSAPKIMAKCGVDHSIK